MDGCVPGRIVYYVVSESVAAEIMRRRTNAISISERIKVNKWPLGAQAHVGNDVNVGDIYPAMILRVWGTSGCSNLKVMLDGSDEYWATSISYENDKRPGSWHWMFDGQDKRYDPKPTRAVDNAPSEPENA